MTAHIAQDLELQTVTAVAEQPFSTAYLVHNTVWRNSFDVLKVYLTRPEAELARDAAEAMTSIAAGWHIAPFRHEGALGDTVRLDVRYVAYNQPCVVEVSTRGRIVADVYQSDLPY